MTYASALAFTLVLATSPMAFAANPMDGMDMKPAAQSSQSKQAPKPVAAEVRKIYPDTGKVTLKHGDIDNLGMGAMTMTFAVKDKAALKNFKEGDKVSAVFDIVNGQATVIEMRHQ
nr:copper-binding protein [uncultured Ralstonia sp.]